jgi:hypothetical protein
MGNYNTVWNISDMGNTGARGDSPSLVIPMNVRKKAVC